MRKLIADCCVLPIVPEHVMTALAHFCSVVDGIDRLLQVDFGGAVMFDDASLGATRH